MVGPRGVGEVDCWFLGVELCEEEATEVDSTGAGDGLQGADLKCGLVAGEIRKGCGIETYTFLAGGGTVRADD